MKKLPPTPREKKIVNKYNYVPSKGKVMPSRSMTIQNDAPSISDMLTKLINNGTARIQPGVYPEDDPDHDDPDVQKFNKMDLTDQGHVLEGIRAMTERLKALEKEYNDELLKKSNPSNQPKNEGQTNS